MKVKIKRKFSLLNLNTSSPQKDDWERSDFMDPNEFYSN